VAVVGGFQRRRRHRRTAVDQVRIEIAELDEKARFDAKDRRADIVPALEQPQHVRAGQRRADRIERDLDRAHRCRQSHARRRRRRRFLRERPGRERQVKPRPNPRASQHDALLGRGHTTPGADSPTPLRMPLATAALAR